MASNSHQDFKTLKREASGKNSILHCLSAVPGFNLKVLNSPGWYLEFLVIFEERFRLLDKTNKDIGF